MNVSDLPPTCRSVGAACVLSIVLVAACVPGQVRGQIPSELVTSEQPIPRDFETWSLFLICNPQWVVPEGSDALADLYSRFRAFGGAIGPDHVAVWFWSRPWTWGETGELHTAVDVVRSSAYCSRLDLPLGESPYVVVSTDYPGTGTVSAYPDSFRVPDNYYVIALSGLNAAETTELLTELAERIVSENLETLEPDSEDYWRRWQTIFEGLQSGIVNFSRRIRISINTQFFTMEWAPDP